jgi:antitoxin component of MazEF toxin-antitoxin module
MGLFMLKKLAKYGNSTTLVIDKAILELLNMNESSIVKLTTDGNSLTITPVAAIGEHEKVSYDTLESLIAAKQSFESKIIHRQVNVDEESQAKMQKDFQDVFQKHNEAFMRFNGQILMSQEFQDALKDITQKVDPSKNPESFYKEFNQLKEQFCPELVDLRKDIEAVGKKYNQLTQ